MGAPQYEQAGADIGGTGTTNTIPRWTGASTLGDSIITQNSTALVTAGSASATQTTFRVRTVGTANNAPVFSLYREGVNEQVIWAGSGTIRFGFATDPAGYTDAQLLTATKMGIDASGNVGIGETSPASYGRLAVTGSAVGAGILGMNTDATRVDIQSYNKPLAINRAGNNTLMNEGGGNVGIGTASPGAQLQVERAGGSSANAEYLRLRNTTVATGSNASQSFFVNGNTVATGNISHAWNGTTYDTIFNAWNGSALAEAGRALGGSTPVLSVPSGLKLPATPGNPDTQTLDAYQEIGTGTPAEIALTLTCGTSGTITVNAASSKARVTRVGNKVIGHGRIVVSSVSAPLGRLSCTLTGCPQPFTNFLVETQTDNTTGLASGNRIVGTSDTAATPTIYFDRYSPNTSSTDAAANIQAGTIIVFNICYSV